MRGRPHAAYRAAAVIAMALSAAPALAAASPPLGEATPGAARPVVTTVVSGADFPTNMAFAPDRRLFYTEKETGNIRIVQDGQLLPQPFATLPVQGGGESGLLGLALDTDFTRSPFVYVYYTSSADGRNHIARLEASSSDPNRGGPPENLLTLLTATGIHNGGDILFGPDGKLYAVAGETGDDALAQDPNSPGGKVLRMNPDGSIPADNPFGSNSYVYSMGHRNSFGLCVSPRDGDLWETENGPSSDDEINRIQAGKNYGWPDQLGPGGAPRFVDPALTFPTVIVPTGCAFFDRPISASSVRPHPGGQLVFGTFGGDLYSVLLKAPRNHDVERDTVEAHFPEGITDVKVGPDGDLYVSTQNSIVRITPGKGIPLTPAGPTTPPPVVTGPGTSGGGGLGAGTIVVIVAAIVLAVDGVIVLVVRRRRRRLEAMRRPPGA